MRTEQLDSFACGCAIRLVADGLPLQASVERECAQHRARATEMSAKAFWMWLRESVGRPR